MIMGRQFEDVSSTYGAPMGRRNYGIAPGEGLRVRLFRVALDAGGYDDGGTYWGVGLPLYCATDGADYRAFIRAGSRFQACALLNLDQTMLATPLQLPGCYQMPLLWSTGEQSLYALAYWNDLIGHFDTVADAVAAALKHCREAVQAKGVNRGN